MGEEKGRGDLCPEEVGQKGAEERHAALKDGERGETHKDPDPVSQGGGLGETGDATISSDGRARGLASRGGPLKTSFTEAKETNGAGKKKEGCEKENEKRKWF